MSLDSLSGGLLSSLNVAVLEHQPDESFLVVGRAPEWLHRLIPESKSSGSIDPANIFDFLGHFIHDARSVWSDRSGKWLCSGPWTEVDPSGEEWLLEAIALNLDERELMLIRFPIAEHHTLRRILQESREQTLEYQHLLKEINKREVLLHCIVHDLSTPLAGIKGSLEMIRQDGHVGAGGEDLLRIALNQTAKMQGLIRDILQAFALDVEPLLPTLVSHDAAPDLLRCSSEVAQVLQASAKTRKVRISVQSEGLDSSFKVVAEQSRLERVLFNLIENALRYAPANSDVVIRIRDEAATVLARIEDEGEGVPQAFLDRLFVKFEQGLGVAGKVGLGLYFCRMTVESWGGKIGYEPRPGGGAAFWFRLPKPAAILSASA